MTLAHYLESSTAYHIVLYTGRDFFEYTPSMLRVLCEPEHMRISHCPYRQMRMLTETRVELREERVLELAESGVRGHKSGWCAYDKLVLAMGSDYPG